MIEKKEPVKKASPTTDKKVKTKGSSKAAPTEVKFDTQNLDEFNTDHKKIIKDGQDEINMKKLFVTEEDNEVMEQFEKEKQQEIEKDLGSQVPKQDIKRGWNEWAGAGVKEDKHTRKVERM